MNTEKKKPTFVRSPEVEAMVKAFCDLAIGETLDYTKLLRISGSDPIEHRDKVMSAIRIARREHRIVMENVRKLGYKRIGDDEIVSTSPSAIKRIRRISSVAKEKFSCANVDTLPQSKRTEAYGRIAAFNMIRMITSSNKQSKLLAIANTTVKPIEISESFKAMFNGKKDE